MRIKVLSAWPKTLKIERLVIVTGDDGGELRVRWQRTHSGKTMWRCDQHGPMDTAQCEHAISAAVALAEDMLGVVVGRGGL